ncbi:MAG TPA: nicotinamide-nucleotide amidohydrolase family protein [Methylomirabilota bacterium]|jgi:nicotinamide-nucleotide amidase|nr:nicotinamide-nucleotide amidohydrolase family protein [Methylomirabilota bacterium]
MTAAHVFTVTPATVGGEDPAGRLVARALSGEGVSVASRQIVAEEETALESALSGALDAGSLIVILAPPGGSGGEIVRRALARSTGTRLVLNDKLLALLEEDFARRGQAMPHRLDRLALLPQGAALWPAPSGEPGWILEARDSLIVVLPPGSAQLPALIDQHLKPLARRRLSGEASVLRILLTAGLSAADAEDRLAPWLGKGGPVSVSSVIVQGDVWVRLLARGASREAAAEALGPVESAVRSALGEDCYGSDDDSLEAVVGTSLVERGLTVSVAESCTGGLLGHRLTNIPGSSRYFERGVIVYSNEAKQELLGVPEALLRAHGAVSRPVAEAMATGICRASGARCGLAVTGIAGPDGGTPTKPVGTVFIAAAAPAGIDVRHFRFTGGRDSVKWQSAQCALDMLRRALVRLPR